MNCGGTGCASRADMEKREHTIFRIAAVTARTLDAWPDMKWEDVEAINRQTGWHTHVLQLETIPDPSDSSDTHGHYRLTRTELHRAWELAHTMREENDFP